MSSALLAGQAFRSQLCQEECCTNVHCKQARAGARPRHLSGGAGVPRAGCGGTGRVTPWHPKATQGTVAAGSASTSSHRRCGSPRGLLRPARHPELREPGWGGAAAARGSVSHPVKLSLGETPASAGNWQQLSKWVC